MHWNNIAMLMADRIAIAEQGYEAALASSEGIQKYGLRSEQQDAEDYVCPSCGTVCHGQEDLKGHQGATQSYAHYARSQQMGEWAKPECKFGEARQTEQDKRGIIRKHYSQHIEDDDMPLARDHISLEPDPNWQPSTSVKSGGSVEMESLFEGVV